MASSRNTSLLRYDSRGPTEVSEISLAVTSRASRFVRLYRGRLLTELRCRKQFGLKADFEVPFFPFSFLDADNR